MVPDISVCKGASRHMESVFLHLDNLVYHGFQVTAMSNDGHGTDESSLKSMTTLSYATDSSKPLNGTSSNSYSAPEDYVTGKEINEPVQENSSNQPKKAAKIHDFCLGIPFGEYHLIL